MISSATARTAARCLVLVATLAAGPAVSAPTAAGESGPERTAAEPGAILEGWSSGWYARMDTSLGSILVRLLPEQAPQTVAHFAALAEGRLSWRDPYTGEEKRAPYYDGLLVHRVTLAERFEAGDPTGTGRGAPTIYVPREVGGPEGFSRSFRVGMTKYGRGRISGAVFFVTATAQPELSVGFPCFGVVVEGKEVVEKIVRARTDRQEKPLEPIRIERIRILKAGNPPPLPEPVPYEPQFLELGPKEPAKGR